MNFSYLLTLLFIAMKLTGVIDWSWFWVVLPAFVHIAIGFACLLMVAFEQTRTGKRKP